MTRPAPTLALLALPLLVAACADEPPALEVAGLAWTEDELLGLPEARREALADLASLGRAVAEGEAGGLVDPRVERAELEWRARVHAADRALDSAGVGDDVLRARYRTDPALELTVRHLLVLSERYETDATRAAARGKAERALERIRAGEPFASVAAEVSEEPGAEGREGLLEPGREGDWVPEFWRAAEALDPGGISPVVETQYGFHVLRLEGRDTVPFEEVRPRVVLEVAGLMGVEPDPYGAEDASAPGRTAEPAPLDDEALRRHLASLPADEWEAARADSAALREVARRAARLRAAAEASGASAPEAVGAGVRREWDDRLATWTYVFGFAEDMSDEALHEAALEALGATGQGPATARESLERYRPLLRLRYPVTLRGGEGGGT